MILLLTAPVWLPLLLLNLYVVGIQYERGGWWQLLAPVAAAGWILDMLLAHSLLALYMRDWPQHSEWTFSQQLGRLTKTSELARYIARVLNAIAPGGEHIRPST